MIKSLLTAAALAALLAAGTVRADSHKGPDQSCRQCDSNLASCQAARNKCTNTDLPACSANLSTCNANAATCAADLAQCQSQSGLAKVLISPPLYLNPNNPTDSLLCLVTNLSSASITADVAIFDGLGTTTYCGVTPVTLAAGTLQGVPCAPNPNNFGSYCKVTLTSSGDAAMRVNYCLVDSSNNVKLCSEAH